MGKKNGQGQESNNREPLTDNGGPLPGEEKGLALANTTELATEEEANALDFTPVPRDRDRFAPFERPIFTFKEIGETFTGLYVDTVQAGDGEDALDYDAILMRVFPSGKYCYLPAHMQLVELFAKDTEEGRTEGRVYQLTLAERVMSDKDPQKVAFTRYEVKDAVLPKKG